MHRGRTGQVWGPANTDTPAQLQTVAGNPRDPDAEAAAFRERPLYEFRHIHREANVFTVAHLWHILLPTAPRIMRAQRAARRVDAQAPAADGRPSSDELTEMIREEAARVGLSTVGFAAYDAKYTFAEFAGQHLEGSVIVCVLEQDYASTQTAPSRRSELMAFRAYCELMERAALLVQFLKQHGVDAQPPADPGGQVLAIHYAERAGLGQMGLNGQLLTPAAGSRARIAVITTDAELVNGQPTDFGIHPICDSCQACVRRCPVGAIPRERKPYRGVTKAKIKTERCFPVVAVAEGCAICMKVCPIQRYGLESVKDHFIEHGEILGAETDELEGYTWPLDGRFYGAKQKPRIDSREVIHPRGWSFDPDRVLPIADPGM
jgi:ferredoxin